MTFVMPKDLCRLEFWRMSDAKDLTATSVYCYHCGQESTEIFEADGHVFCCFGCKTIYEILRDNGLCNYYALESSPGTRETTVADQDSYALLDDPDVAMSLTRFSTSDITKSEFFVPSIHCISCIWLLENLHRLSPGIVRSEVNFPKKTVAVFFRSRETTLRSVAGLLSRIGYAPRITLDADQKKGPAYDRTLLLKLGVAGFAFGNIMLFSFPEYLGIDRAETQLIFWFSLLNIVLSLPVLFYSASGYLTSAYHSLRRKALNLDVPLSAGILALVVRSYIDIFTGNGPGYLDSFAGLIFFLLLGKWFQNVTFENLSFDRDYQSFFPLAVNKVHDSKLEPVLVSTLKPGDVIQVRNQEIIPCDSIMLDKEALADYSFVTGESRPVLLRKDEPVFAGGKLLGLPVQLRVEKEIAQGHLTSLWNSDIFRKPNESQFRRLVDQTARRFTWILLFIAIAAGFFWQITEPTRVWLVVSSILIVACPCALALSAPFTFGHMLRVFGRNGFYLKNADVLERMSSIEKIVFDKTGTVTHSEGPSVTFSGMLTEDEKRAVKAVVSASTHPLSVQIRKFFELTPPRELIQLEEIQSKGLLARTSSGCRIRLGSPAWLEQSSPPNRTGSLIALEIDSKFKGFFEIRTAIRPGFADLVKKLGAKCLAVLSGDHKGGVECIRNVFPDSTNFMSDQSPADKLEFIRSRPEKIMMVGDGLNDAGALKQSHVGIAVTDDTGIFTPACDGIIKGQNLSKLDIFLDLSKTAVRIVRACFIISFLYNLVGLGFAVTGYLSPLVAAILMPLSSITIVVFTSLAVHFFSDLKRL